MEAVAWLAGEEHTDRPVCTCPVIASMVRRLNDRIVDDKLGTELLAPLLPKLIGTRAALPVMRRRAFIAADFSVRVAAPLALEARGQKENAEKLRALPEVVDCESALVAKRSADAAADAAAAAYAADAADAAADAADADARIKVYRLTIECIERMCAATEET